jgi:hypothetical protein
LAEEIAVSVINTKQGLRSPRRRKKEPGPEAAADQDRPQASSNFDRELQDHFAAETRKKVEEATENIFGPPLARYGWVRNEQGHVEYVGGEGA